MSRVGGKQGRGGAKPGRRAPNVLRMKFLRRLRGILSHSFPPSATLSTHGDALLSKLDEDMKSSEEWTSLSTERRWKEVGWLLSRARYKNSAKGKLRSTRQKLAYRQKKEGSA